MLGAPSGELAFVLGLGPQDHVDALRERRRRLGATCQVHESARCIAGTNVPESLQDIDYCAVVVRDPGVVALSQRKVLRPACVRVLCCKELAHSTLEGLSASRVARAIDHHGSRRLQVRTIGLSGLFSHGPSGDFERAETTMCDLEGPAVPPYADVS